MAHEGGCMFVADTVGFVNNAKFLNSVAHSLGGAIVLSGDSDISFDSCEIYGCTAMSGGGLVLQGKSKANLINTTVHYCSANSSAGGMLISDLSTLTTKDCIIHDNIASSAGGGIYIANYAIFKDTNSLIR